MKEEKRSTPKLRFPGFEGDWEKRKLSDIYQKIGNAFVGTATPYYVESGHFYLESNNVKDGQINHNTEVFINDEFYERQKDKWLHTGDMVMVQSGHVGHAAVIPEELDNTAAHALIMFRSPIVKIDPYFLNYQYQTLSAKKKIENITTGNTIKHILASDMQEFVVDVTSYEEQLKVAGCFQQLDNRITLHQRKLDQIKEYKKGMLQKMFPKKGETVPEVRFPGFEGDWEEKKLGCLTDFVTGKAFSANLSDNGSFIVMDMGTVSQEGNRLEKKTTDIKRDVLRKNDLIMPKDDIGGGLIIGKTAYIPKDNQYVLGDHVYRLRFVHDNGLFFHYQINSDSVRKQILPLVTGSAQLGLNSKNIQGVMVHVPSLNEQVIIGKFFKNLDFLITLQQHKINEMKEYKKGLLQQMFV